jgi:hypothetical protein
MNARPRNDPFEELNNLSEALYGEASEMTLEEASDLLDASGLDPRILKANLRRRALELQEQYNRGGQNPPRVLEKIIGDLASQGGELQGERQWIIKLLNDIRQLPQLLHSGFEPSFSHAYRNKKELSDADQALLDRVAAEMRKNFKDSR